MVIHFAALFMQKIPLKLQVRLVLVLVQTLIE